jgi:uncharacterized surface protein with fasciclin (FAS1) repeats
MTKFIHKIGGMMALAALGVASFTSCSEEIDDSNLYTFTGQTVIDYLRSDSTLSDIAKISDRAGMSDRLSAYGTYTCFAPTNEALEVYIDSLYNDVKSDNHNGLYAGEVPADSVMNRLWKSEKCDSLCKDIIESQVTGQKKTTNNFLTGADITMMLGNTHTPKRVNGEITIDGTTHFIKTDQEVENGIVHVIDRLFYRSTNYLIDEMEAMGCYGLWVEALRKTGIDKILQESIRTKGIHWFNLEPEAGTDYPTKCKVGFTIFAEPDEVLAKEGITTFEQLVERANKEYENCGNWYDYVKDAGISVSTKDDYTNQWNALNMFIRYHILHYALSTDKLVYSFNELKNIDVYEYVRTLLPGTMFKLTGIKDPGGNIGEIYINRQLTTPSLTSDPGNTSLISNAYQEANNVKDPGILVGNSKVNSRQASNGYIHPISSMLIYKENVPNEVLNERLRFDFMALLDESMTNRFRSYTGADLKSFFGRTDGNITSVRFPEGYFENMVIYNGEASRVNYLTRDHANGYHGYDCWNDYQGDELYCKGAYDFAIKLPPVPKDGTYELRFGYVNNGKRTIVQFYLGHSSDRSTMTPCDIPLDQNVDLKSTTVGWTDPNTDGDNGAAVDKAMHNRGWMRGPNYFSNMKHGEGSTARFKYDGGQHHIRRVVTKQYFKQGEENWFRCKTAMPENTEAEFQLDYIELVPATVYNHSSLTEDVF